MRTVHTHWLIEQYNKQPENTAMIFNDVSYTFEDVYRISKDVASHIKTLNSKRIGLFIHNHSDAYFLLNACMLLGVEVVMLNNRLTSNEIKVQLEDVDVDTVIATKSLEVEGINVISYSELEHITPVSFQINRFSMDEPLSIMFTSGTTGRAKAVIQTYGNHFASDRRCRIGMGYSDDSTWLLVNPMFHISGLSIVFRALITGCTLVINEIFDEESVIGLLSKYKITHTSFVPIMLERLLDYEFDWRQIEGVLLGGAGVRRPLIERSLALGIRIYNSYGMTETMSQMIMIGFEDSKMLDGAVGKVVDLEIKLDSNHQIHVDLPIVTPGYLNAAIDKKNGYFNTGDIGRIDGEGYLYILDRRQDLIISGGENIYPSEIEKAVHQVLPNVECVVVKRADEIWGEIPVLILECETNSNYMTLLKKYFDEKLSRYKHPKEIMFVDKIMRTQTGKISRQLNKNKYVGE